MPKISTGQTMIKFASYLRIGYRAENSSGHYTYFPQYFSQEQLPITIDLPSSGSWEIEYTEICPNCSGGIYSNPVVVLVVV